MSQNHPQNFSRFANLLSFVIAIMVLAPSLALAVNLPSTADPSRIDQRLSAPTLEPELNAPSIAPPAETHTQLPPGSEKVHFVLKEVVIEGATVYSDADLKPIYQDLIGKNVTLAEMIGVADKITAKYRNAGYILTRAVVPEQSVSGGVIHIRVVEGYISKVRFDGPLKETAALQDYATHIENVRPLTTQALERYLLLANDVPGITVKGVLQRSETVPGSAELVMVSERKIVSADATVDNRGSKYLGPDEVSLSSSLNDAFGYGEQVGVAYTTTANGELNYYSGNASIGIGNDGTRLAFIASDTETKPGFTLKQFDTTGTADLYQLQLSHPFIRTREQNLLGLFRIDAHDVENKQLGFITSNDKIRSARLGANYEVSDSWNGVNTINGLYSEGFHLLGASDSGSPNLSRLRGQSDYQKINIDMQRVQAVVPDVNLVLAASGQFAFDDLLTSEQFGVGGATYGRGYDDFEIIGDDGFATKAEIQYNRHLGLTENDILQPYGFFDFGDVRNKHVLAAEQKEQSLASTGIGLRLKLTNNFSGQLEIAQPLTKDVATEQNKDPRFFFGVTAHY